MTALQVVKAEFDGNEIQFREDGWFNATDAAAKFGKEPFDWLRQRDTVEYITILAEQYGKSNSGFVPEFNEIKGLDSKSGASRAKLLRLIKKTGLVTTKTGPSEIGGGTWFHPKLGVAFARWLDVRFSIWCDIQIDALLRGKVDQKKMRHEAAASFKVMQSILKATRDDVGKETKPYHYSNEARLISFALSGKFGSIDRDTLSASDLTVLAKLEEKNTILISRGVDYKARKTILEQHAVDLREVRLIA